PLRPLPVPARFCAQFLSASSASALRAAGFPRAEPHRPHGLRSSRHARKIFSPSRSLGNTADAICDGPPARQWSCSCGSKPRCRSLLCAFRLFVFPPLLLLPCGCSLAGNRFHPSDVLAQAADLLQALRLPHVELEFQLKKLVAHFAFLVPKLFVGQVSDFFCFHKSSQLALSGERRAVSNP